MRTERRTTRHAIFTRVIPAAVMLSCALRAPHSLAQSNPTAEAKESFERGYALFQRGDFEAAAALFERAHTLRPNYSVLYNLAQAYASSGQFVLAVNAFERYLSDGGAEIPEERRKTVESAIRYYGSRIGALELVVTPAGAEVAVDGRGVGVAPIRSSVRVNAGPHVVTATLPHHAPAVRSVTVTGGTSSRVELTLVRERLVDFHIACGVPNVVLSVNGEPLPPAAARVLRLPQAQQEFEFRRAGYLPQLFTLTPEGVGPVTLRCDLQLDPTLPDHPSLRVKHPLGTRVRIDGAPFRSGAVGSGKHVIEVTGPGYTPLRTELSLKPRERRVVELVPERSRRERERAAERAMNLRHTIAYVLGGSGLVAGTVAAVLFVANDGSHDDWKRDNREFIDRFNADPRSVSASELDALIERENSIRDRDMLAVNLAVAGGAALVGAAVLRFWPSSSRPPPLVSRPAGNLSHGFRF
jgi:hypothetical protein